MQKAEGMIAQLKQVSDIVVGVHIRRGDYATWNDGRFFYELEDYHQFMLNVKELYKDRKVSFFISSNENFSLDIFNGCHCCRFGQEPSGAILDLYTLSLCDRIIGPFSSYSRWASFIGEIPLCFLEVKNQQFSESDFSKIVDYFHFDGVRVDAVSNIENCDIDLRHTPYSCCSRRSSGKSNRFLPGIQQSA